MNYTILIHEREDIIAMRDDPAKREALFGPIGAYLHALREAGVFVGGAGLQAPDTATCFVQANGGWRTQDGPFADTKEQLAGYITINVPNHDEALSWARRCPLMPGRAVELRGNLIPLE